MKKVLNGLKWYHFIAYLFLTIYTKFSYFLLLSFVLSNNNLNKYKYCVIYYYDITLWFYIIYCNYYAILSTIC